MIGLEGASVSFGQRQIFDDLSFHAPIGRTLAILGPNGRGKTTTLRAMLGFQKLAKGRRIAPEIVGYVPQIASKGHRLRVIDIVVMARARALGLFRQPRAEDFDAARAALDEVGALAFERAFFDRLSGGERQLVLLARALLTGSPVLVLDEPAAALDLRNQKRLLALLQKFRLDGDKAIIFTTHEPNHALAVADDALLMLPDGKYINGPVDEMITLSNLERLYGVSMREVDLNSGAGQRRRAVLPAFIGADAS